MQNSHLSLIHENLPQAMGNWALFLDIDGTLAELMPRPDQVSIPKPVLSGIRDIHARLEGAVALVSGRTLEDIDGLAAPWSFTVAGQHGLELRMPDGTVKQAAYNRMVLEAVAEKIAQFHENFPQLLVEYKGLSIAVHYRQAPTLERLVKPFMRQLAADAGHEVALLEGKMVLELRLRNADKGQAIAQLMQVAPFRNRIPVFIGDDVTDEDGFRAVNMLGGISIKIGEGDSCASYRLQNPAALHAWLQSGFSHIAPPIGTESSYQAEAKVSCF